MKRPLLAIPVLCAIAFLASACSGSSQSSSAPSSTTIATSTSSTATAGPLAAVNPCSLLTPSQLPQHQLGQGSASSPAVGVRQCEWERLNTSGGAVDDSAYVLAAAIFDNTSLQNYNETGDTTAPYQSFGQHQALLAKITASNTCEVQISASSTTTLTISVDPLLGNIDYACTVVEQAAPIMVANLPANW